MRNIGKEKQPRLMIFFLILLSLIADPVEMLLEDSGIKGKSRELLKMVQRNALADVYKRQGVPNTEVFSET